MAHSLKNVLFIFSAVILMFLNTVICFCQTGKLLTYEDGKGNTYIITNDSVIYVPINTEMSSSGEYEGSEKRTVEISQNQFDEIEKEFTDIFNNDSMHIKKRIKTSGLLTIVHGSKKEQMIIAECPVQYELEELLRKSLNLENKENTQIVVKGCARNAKAGAIVESPEGNVFYVDGMEYWNDSILNKTVEVRGFLKKEFHMPEDLKTDDGGWIQGMTGEKIILLQPEWIVTDNKD